MKRLNSARCGLRIGKHACCCALPEETTKHTGRHSLESRPQTPPVLALAMKTVGLGRIVLWEGASLWAFEVPRMPTAPHQTQAHATHALQLTFSVGGAFSFLIGGDIVDGPLC